MLCTKKSFYRKFTLASNFVYIRILKLKKNSQRNIFAKGEHRVILGEIGFKHEIDLFRNDPENAKNILYYPNEYFNESNWNIDSISLSFDIWCLGVVFWEILTQQKLFTNQSEIKDERFISTIESSGICKDLEKLILK